MANTNTVTIRKNDVLMQLDEVIIEIQREADDSENKYNHEISVANRAYWQGLNTGTNTAVRKLEALRSMIDAY